MKAYGGASGPTVADHGGAFMLRGKRAAALLGDDASQAIAIIKFPSAQAAQGWFASPEYQALQEPRDAAADMEFTLFDVASPGANFLNS